MSSITIRWGGPPARSPVSTIIAAIIAIAGLVSAVIFARDLPWPFWPIMGGFGVYLLIAYFIIPDADRDDLGWFGGLIDNPFRFGDDANRMLLVWGILLWPGRFIGEAIIGALLLPLRPKGS